MTKEYRRSSNGDQLIKGLLLVLIFGIVAMPLVGMSFIKKKENMLLTKILGFIMLLVSTIAWGIVGYYSIYN